MSAAGAPVTILSKTEHELRDTIEGPESEEERGWEFARMEAGRVLGK